MPKFPKILPKILLTELEQPQIKCNGVLLKYSLCSNVVHALKSDWITCYQRKPQKYL